LIGQIVKSNKQDFIIYFNGKFYHKEIPCEFTGTWNFFSFLENYDNIEYANFYKNAETLEEACPEDQKERFKEINLKIKSYLNSFKQVKLNFQNYSLYDLIPQKTLIEFYETKNMITQNILKNSVRLEHYEILKNNAKVFSNIKEQKLNLDYSCLNNEINTDKVQRLFVKRQNFVPYIKYNFHGTKIGGMSLEYGSFPILNLKKDLRKIIKPVNDFFVSFDYNGAHLRVMLSLIGLQQPKEDIYEWNIKNILKCDISRENVKKMAFHWLYSDTSTLLDSAYDKKILLEKYFFGDKIKNVFGREIESNRFHAINYIVASSFNDMFSQQFYKIYQLLKGKKTFISALIHDSILIDFNKSEEHLIDEISNLLSDTIFGEFRVNIEKGNDFGNMKKWEE
jgi:hypothetical protein